MASRFGEVQVTIWSAKDLKNVNWPQGPLRPYVVVWVDPAMRFTTRVDEEGHQFPQWEQTLTVPLNAPPTDSTLYIDVVHANAAEDTKPLIGSARLPIRDVLDDPRSTRKLDLRHPSGRPHGKISVQATVIGSRYGEPDPYRSQPYGVRSYDAPPPPAAYAPPYAATPPRPAAYAPPYAATPPPPAAYAPPYAATPPPPAAYGPPYAATPPPPAAYGPPYAATPPPPAAYAPPYAATPPPPAAYAPPYATTPPPPAAYAPPYAATPLPPAAYAPPYAATPPPPAAYAPPYAAAPPPPGYGYGQGGYWFVPGSVAASAPVVEQKKSYFGTGTASVVGLLRGLAIFTALDSLVS